MEQTLEKFYNYKQEIKRMEKECEKLKKIIKKRMKQDEVNTITRGMYTVKKRSMSSSRINKKDVPKDIWEQYSVITKYDALYIGLKK